MLFFFLFPLGSGMSPPSCSSQNSQYWSWPRGFLPQAVCISSPSKEKATPWLPRVDSG